MSKSIEEERIDALVTAAKTIFVGTMQVATEIGAEQLEQMFDQLMALGMQVQRLKSVVESLDHLELQLEEAILSDPL